MTCGIYYLSFFGTDKVYIGKSKNIESRFKYHKSSMHSLSSPKKLQSAYDAYGEPTLNIMIECNEDQLDNLEYEKIREYNSIIDGFNTLSCSGGGSTSNLIGELHHNAKHSNSQIVEAFLLLVNTDITAKNISIKTGVSISVVSDISKCINHMWLKAEYPKEYSILVTKKGNRKYNSAEAQGKVYPALIDINGVVYLDISNITQFAKLHGLDPGGLNKVLNGKANSIKGWKLAD